MTWDSATSNRDHVPYGVLVELLLEEPARFHTGVGFLPWNGEQWGGVGELGEIGAISTSTEIEAGDLTLTLSGIPTDFRPYLLDQVSRGKRVNIYHGIADELGGGWELEPELELAGFIGGSDLTDVVDEAGGATVTVSIYVLSATAYVRRRTVHRRTHADQLSFFSDDNFYSFKTDVMHPTIQPPTTSHNAMVHWVKTNVQSAKDYYASLPSRA